MRKARQLREMFRSKKVVRIVGAHNGMSAKLVEKAGFEGVWASGLEVSTAHAVPDANILTMSDYLRVASYMNDAVSIPVVVDADTGYGNSNNVIYTVQKFEAAGIAAICMEDKLFPKVNSFVPGRQELAPIAEFVGKIMAAKNAQESPDFMVIARVEALIAGWGMEEALKRANAYAEAGADAVFIHSKQKETQEIEEFIQAWKSETPLVVCPTTYPGFTVEKAEKSGKVKIYIFANHGIRSAIKAMEETFATLQKTNDIRSVENNISSMKNVFDIQGMPEMKANEKKYLLTESSARAIIPAAGAAKHDVSLLKDLLQDRPLGMLDVNGKSILQRNIEIFNQLGVQDIAIVSGYEGSKINLDQVDIIENKDYDKNGILHSIMCARGHLKGKTIVAFSDILFEKNIIERLLKRQEDVVIVIDRSWQDTKTNGRPIDLIKASNLPPQGERVVGLEQDNPVVKMGQSLSPEEATHEFIGIAMFSEKGAQALLSLYDEFSENPPSGSFYEAESFSKADLSDILQAMMDRGHKVSSLEIHKGWMEVHNFEDYKRACEMIRG